jgi:hydroxymethylbilane synthase
MSGADVTIRIATRSSALALVQARQVQALLAARGVGAELVTYTTVGDRQLDRPLAAIGVKGLFTAELERDLLDGRVDCCVHSLKDLPTESPPALAVVAHLEREDPRDALVLAPGVAATDVDDLPRGAVVGTSSLRRRAQLLARRPDLRVVELRGNVPTRVRKVDEGQVQAAILAAAGLRRLDLAGRIARLLDPPAWLAAAGQGAIALQARLGDERVLAVLAALDHSPTTRAIAAERAFLATLEGGCQVPIGAAVVHEGGADVLHGFVADLAGRDVVRGSQPVGDDAAAAGRALAERLRGEGAERVLAAVRAAGPVPAPQPE